MLTDTFCNSINSINSIHSIVRCSTFLARPDGRVATPHAQCRAKSTWIAQSIHFGWKPPIAGCSGAHSAGAQSLWISMGSLGSPAEAEHAGVHVEIRSVLLHKGLSEQVLNHATITVIVTGEVHCAQEVCISNAGSCNSPSVVSWQLRS